MTNETLPPALAGQVERGVRPLADRLEDHGLQYGERLYYEAAKELRRLHAALEKYEADAYWRNDTQLYARPGLTHEQACALHTMLDHYGNDPRMRCLVELLPANMRRDFAA
ncbi:MAG: hypothetical protein ACK5X3_09130 [Pseudomonadota bacterium]|jgi:peptide methionine sulfoxide reductase MsrA